jgi:hypothetical protein
MSFFVTYGVALWLIGTLALRFFGRNLLDPSHPVKLVVLFAISFPLMAWLLRRLCVKRNLPSPEWARAALYFVLPSLLLDSMASVFFAQVYPEMPREWAGVFGGWILWCCGGAVTGVIRRDGR